MKEIRVGLLPCYVELYDETVPEMRPAVEEYLEEVSRQLISEGLTLLRAPICRLKGEFEKAVRQFETQNADAIVSIHLAYSPSLESADVLAGTKLPILILDTTRDELFDHTVPSGELMYNHGIHGVQDLCNLLRRRKKSCEIFAGHYINSDVCRRVANAARGIKAAASLSGMRVGILGDPFEGMGDFQVSDKALEKLGINVIHCTENLLENIACTVTNDEIKAEYEKDKKIKDVEKISFETYEKTERVALTVRKWIEYEELNAFTMNFRVAGHFRGFPTMPFSEAGKEMAAGIGYAGEGDVLTAAFIGALMAGFKEVNFAEMFCPDWKNGTVFLSHMGEINHAIALNKHMIIKDFPYATGYDPTCILGHMKSGKACFVNLAPTGDSEFEVIAADGNMILLPQEIKNFNDTVSGWFQPEKPLTEFLEEFSRSGGTHHSAVVYGVDTESICCFARRLGIKCKVI